MLVIYSFLIAIVLIVSETLFLSSESKFPIFIESDLVVKCENKSCLVPVGELNRIPGPRNEYAFSSQFISSPPPWYSYKLAQIGQNFFKKNFAGYALAQLYGFCFIASSVDYIRVFASAGNASTTIEAARKRYLTIAAFNAYFAEMQLPLDRSFPLDENENNEVTYDYFDLINTVRSIHQKIGDKALHYPTRFKEPMIQNPTSKLRYPQIWEAFHKDVQKSKYLQRFKHREIFPPKNAYGTDIHFNQFAMMLQTWTVVGVPLLFPEKVYMQIPKNERDEGWLGYLHFCGLAFYTMGVENKYNFGLQPSLSEAKKYYWEFMEEYLLPGFANLDQFPESMVMIELALEGMNLATLPLLDLGSTLIQVLNFLNVPSSNLYQILNPRGRFSVDLLFPIGANFLSQSEFYRNLGNNVAFGVMSGSVMNEFGININNFTNFTNGMKILAESTLKNTDIWLIKAQNKEKKIQNYLQ